MSIKSKVAWLTLDRGTRFGASLVNGALTARALSLDEFGVLAQALLALAILDTAGSFGLPSVMSSRTAISAQSARTPLLARVLVTRTVAAAAAGLIALALLSLSPQSRLGWDIATLIVAGLVLMNWSISDGYLQGIGMPECGAVTKSLVSLAFVAVRWIHIEQQSPSAYSLMLIYCVEQFVLSCGMLAMCWWAGRSAVPDAKAATEAPPFLRHAAVMWLSQLITLVYMRVDQTIITALGTRPELSIYAVASQLAEQAYTLPIILNAVVVGRIGSLRRNDPDKLSAAMVKLYRQGFAAGLLLAIASALVAPFAVPLIYGEKFRDASTLFMILVFSVPFVTLGGLQSLTILTGNDPMLQLRKTGSAALLSIPLALLAWHFGGSTGLALSVVGIQCFSCLLSNRIFDRHTYGEQILALKFLRPLP